MAVKPRVYLETSVISYLVGRPSRDVVVLGNQKLTREWWSGNRIDWDMFISQVVIAEIAAGDSALADETPPFGAQSRISAEPAVMSRR
jgi:hypothetical protein